MAPDGFIDLGSRSALRLTGTGVSLAWIRATAACQSQLVTDPKAALAAAGFTFRSVRAPERKWMPARLPQHRLVEQIESTVVLPVGRLAYLWAHLCGVAARARSLQARPATAPCS